MRVTHRPVDAALAGTEILSFYTPAQNGGAAASQLQTVLSKLPLVVDVSGANPTTLTVVGDSLTATSDCAAAINWREIK